MPFSYLPRIALTLFAAMYLASCSQGGGSGTTTQTFSSLYSNTFSGCKQCHSPNGSATASGTKLDFTTSTTAYNTLVGTKTKSPSNLDCASLTMVISGSSQTSYLTALFDTSLQNGNFNGTNCRPENTHISYISQSDLSSITAWINQGAQNN